MKYILEQHKSKFVKDYYYFTISKDNGEIPSLETTGVHKLNSKVHKELQKMVDVLNGEKVSVLYLKECQKKNKA